MALEVLTQFAPGMPKVNHVMACERATSKQGVLPWTQQLAAMRAINGPCPVRLELNLSWQLPSAQHASRGATPSPPYSTSSPTSRR